MHLTDVIACSLIGVYVPLAFVFRLRPNLPLLAAPVLLTITGILMAMGNHDLADQLGFCVFYLLVGGATLLVAERINQRSLDE